MKKINSDRSKYMIINKNITDRKKQQYGSMQRKELEMVLTISGRYYYRLV